MLALGVPDLRPSTLVGELDTLLADHRWFVPEIAPAFTDDVRARLESVRPRLEALAAELASGVPATIQHDDLHSANVFVADGQTEPGAGVLVARKVRVIDWGDAVVAHPFSTLRVTLDGLESQLGVERSSPELRRVTDAYLEVWQERGESRAELRRQLDLAWLERFADDLAADGHG